MGTWRARRRVQTGAIISLVSKLKFCVEGDALVVSSGVAKTVALSLAADAVRVSTSGLDPVTLPWALYGENTGGMGSVPRDGWLITSFALGRYAEFGVAVHVTGELVVSTHDLYRTTMSRWRRFHAWGRGRLGTGQGLPIVPAWTAVGICEAERATLGALLTVLSQEPGLRQRLSEPLRLQQLAQDLSVRVLGPVVEKGGIGRDSADVLHAMHKAGFVHRYGRPLAIGSVSSLDRATEMTRAHLEANPYRKGRATDGRLLERLLRRNYLDVEPWPFAALVEPNS